MSEKDDRTQWHRLLGLVLEPLFRELGYETLIEEDVSSKQQFVDIVAIKKSTVLDKLSLLPKIYWEAFEDFNDHNLLSFKSYSESFNPESCEELYGHLTNYKKKNNLKAEQVNLYALVHHYPQKLLSPYEKTRFFKTVKEGEIFDLDLEGIKRIRFIVARKTDNPVLGLFSGDRDKVFNCYKILEEQTTILKGLSSYLNKIQEYYGVEVNWMYTKEDFFKDYPPTGKKFAFPWEEEYHENELKKIREEAEEKARLAEEKAKKLAEEKARLAEEKAKRLAEDMEKLGEIKGKIALYKEQLSQGVITKEYYNSVFPQLEIKLTALERKLR
jgi:hypothetical protein